MAVAAAALAVGCRAAQAATRGASAAAAAAKWLPNPLLLLEVARSPWTNCRCP